MAGSVVWPGARGRGGGWRGGRGGGNERRWHGRRQQLERQQLQRQQLQLERQGKGSLDGFAGMTSRTGPRRVKKSTEEGPLRSRMGTSPR